MFRVDDTVDVNGTSLVGSIEITRREIEVVFGKPTYRGDRYDKVTCEWTIQFDDGTVATIYDWKRYSDGTPKMDEKYDWHIGGHSTAAEDYVRDYLNEWALV